jgi:glucosamine-6-phosphate deaminase
MMMKVYRDKRSLGRAAAEQAAVAIRSAIRQRGKARIIAATGSSQFECLETLTTVPGVSWDQVELFHLDEYIGLAPTDPASFCRYLQERLIQKTGIIEYHLLNGEKDPAEVIGTVGAALLAAPVDLAFVGLGENGHLAFNDPPADFRTEAPYIVVTLDEASRRQQLREGWFSTLEAVPRQAISMTVHEILKAKEIVCIATDARKAKAVKQCFEGDISPLAPASILRTHPNTTVYLDEYAAALLEQAVSLSS